MALLRKPILAKVRVQGTKNSVEIITLVDTDASLSIIDESLANHMGVEFPKKKKLTSKEYVTKLKGY